MTARTGRPRWSENIRRLLLALLAFAVAVIVNTTSVELQQRHRWLTRWFGPKDWYVHLALIAPGYLWFFRALKDLGGTVRWPLPAAWQRFNQPVLAASTLLWLEAYRQLGLAGMLNRNFFSGGSTRAVRGGMFRWFRDPVYVSYVLAFVGWALRRRNAVYLLLAAESWLLLNVIEAKVENRSFESWKVRRVSIALTAIALWLGLAVPAGYAAEGCQFARGFKGLHDQIPAIVGECLSNEQDGGGGTRIQRAANGVLVWRQIDNLSAFTDGAQTWVKGPFGVQQRANDQRFAWEANPAPGSEPPAKGIFIELGKQSLTAYEDGRIVLQTPVTTGGPSTPTQPGSFPVIAKRGNFMFKSPWPQPDPRWYPDSWVNFALLYERTGFFVHDAPWRNVYGPGTNLTYNPSIGWTGTHGCVNVPYEAEARLYQWADIGTPVVVMQ